MATAALTREWELRTGENSIKYTVAVDDFGEKIASFQAGEGIRSKDFQVGGSVFRLHIYPSGNSTAVAVYLANLSDREVIADVKFQVGDLKRELQKQRRFGTRTDGYNSRGFSNMVPHLRCTDGDLLRDGVFEIDVFIDLDVEDLGNSKMKSHVDKKFEAAEKKFEAVGKKVEAVEKKLQAMEKKMDNKMTAMEKKVEAVENKMDNKMTRKFQALEKKIEDKFNQIGQSLAEAGKF